MDRLSRAGPIVAVVLCGVAPAGCGSGGPVELDIAEAGPARFAAVGAAAGADQLAVDVMVRAGPLQAALERSASLALAVFECDKPDAAGAAVPLSFGGQPIGDLDASQVSGDPDTLVLLSAAIPRGTTTASPRCARLVRATDSSGPEIVSRAVPLRN